MKKRIIKSGSIALAITTLMCLVNYILGKTYEKIIGIKIWGGDVAPINFILTVITLGVVVYFICLIAEMRKNRSFSKIDKV